MDININYIKILKALNLLKRSDVLFLVGAQDITIPLSSEFYLIGWYYHRRLFLLLYSFDNIHWREKPF